LAPVAGTKESNKSNGIKVYDLDILARVKLFESTKEHFITNFLLSEDDQLLITVESGLNDCITFYDFDTKKEIYNFN
jgi:hypothetical protein